MPRSSLLLALLALAAASSVCCQTIADVAASQPDLSTFAAAVNACPPIQQAAANASTAVTVFAPTNEAFTTALIILNTTAGAFFNDTSILCAVLEYHIIDEVIPSSNITNITMDVPTMLPGSNVTLVLINGTVQVNDAQVMTPDVSAGSSLVNVIDHVLLPAFLRPAPSPTIFGTLSVVPDLSVLLAAIASCPPILEAAVNSSTSVTLFAPTNEAFANALQALNTTADAFLNNTGLLCSVLSYHIVEGRVFSYNVTETSMDLATLLADANVTVAGTNGTLTVNGVTVQSMDILAGASVIQVIGQVLTPPETATPTPSPPPVATTIVSVAATVPTLSTFLSAVAACPSLLAAATNSSTAVTIFAPSNDAFAAYLDSRNMNTTDLLNNTQLCSILDMHVCQGVVPLADADAGPVVLPTLMEGFNLTLQNTNGSYTINGAHIVISTIYAGDSIIYVIDMVLEAAQPPAPVPPPTIARVCSGIPQLSTLVMYIEMSPTVFAASTDPSTNVTLFAPSNEAFATGIAKIARQNCMTADQIMDDRDFVSALLAYHMSPQVLPSSSISNCTKGTKIPTLLYREYLNLQRDDTFVSVNDAYITQADIPAGPTVVHIIDRLLVPNDLESYFTNYTGCACSGCSSGTWSARRLLGMGRSRKALQLAGL